MSEASADLTSLTVELVRAYVSNNSVKPDQLTDLIQSTHAALNQTRTPVEPEVPAPEFTPAVSVRKSLASRDHIISLIDGKPYRTLKRHLTGHGLTIDQYRERYGLPASYPTVAPSYSERRREVAHRLGLGRKPAASAPVVVPPAKAKRRSSAPKVSEPQEA